MDSESVFLQMMREKNGGEDAHTVASSAVDAMSVYSGVPTTYYSKKYDQYNDQLNREKDRRLNIESQISKIKAQMLNQANLLKMHQTSSNDTEGKMRIVDQRNCMQTGVNYTTHPQTENL